MKPVRFNFPRLPRLMPELPKLILTGDEQHNLTPAMTFPLLQKVRAA